MQASSATSASPRKAAALPKKRMCDCGMLRSLFNSDCLVWEDEHILPHQKELLGPPQSWWWHGNGCWFSEQCSPQGSCAILRKNSIVCGERHLLVLAEVCLAEQKLFWLQRGARFLHVRLLIVVSWLTVLIRQVFYPAWLVFCPWRGVIQQSGKRMFM